MSPNDQEALCLLTIWISFVKCLFKSFPHFLNSIVCFYLTYLSEFLTNAGYGSSVECNIANIFSHTVFSLSYVLINVSFKLYCSPIYQSFPLWLLVFMPYLRNLSWPQGDKDIHLC